MKYARCPNCNGRLGIPNKKRGRPINCPKCDTEFVAPDHLDGQTSNASSTPAAKTSQSSNPAGRATPSIRALPLPSGIASTDESVSTPGLDLTPPEKQTPINLTAPRPASDPMMPPRSKQTSSSPETSTPSSPLDPPSSKSSTATPANQAAKSPLPVASNAKLTGNSVVVEPTVVPEPTAKTSEKPAKPQRSVATIVKTESVQPALTKDGKLPTLQLTDEIEAKPKEESQTNPVLLVTIVVASLLSSLLMMLMLGGDSNNRQERIDKTREQIRVFYQVRPDQDIKPYQTDLRQAQLANSRGDYRTEIRAYETVMARFRDENFDQYTGLTGSQNSDRELEKWVSILLDEAKRNAKR